VRAGALAGANWMEARLFPETPVADDHWVRVVMNEAVDHFLAGLDVGTLTAAEISGTSHSSRGWAAYRSLMYPEFDVCAPVVIDERFDVVLCEQVLEHVVDPWAGVANLAELCRPGGHVVITSPFLIKVHELPMYGMFDYWRFTPRGLQLMVEKVGLEVVDQGQWGNRMCVTGNLTHWSARRRWHPMRNEPDVPVQIWCIARRPN
jgi:SAM-dependent methyltransferase